MSEPQIFHDGRCVLHAGDCLDVLRSLPADSVDACVTDPPYHLTSIVRRFGAPDAAAAIDYSARRAGATGAYARASRGFMGKQWDGGDIAFRAELWREVWRILKPGGYCLAFSATRTYHRMACAIEDAGFEIRDLIAWLYGSGFPKSHDVSKAIDKAMGVEGSYGAPKSAAQAGWIKRGALRAGGGHEGYQRPWMDDGEAVERAARRYQPGSPEAAAWQGWGTALKPALEPVCFARKPFSEKTVAANVLAHGVGALNIDACRIDFAGEDDTAPGRWPANVAHDGSDAVRALFPFDASRPRAPSTFRAEAYKGLGEDGGAFAIRARAMAGIHRGDAGSAARYFYSAKAGADDRIGSKHPTVKPVDLMRWLVRLVARKGAVVLDPFAGTGTTGAAALIEGMSAVLIEREADYRADIARRMACLFEGEVGRANAAPSAPGDAPGEAGKGDALPLFDAPARGGMAGGRRVYGAFARDKGRV